MPKIHRIGNQGRHMLDCGHVYSFEELKGNITDPLEFLDKDYNCSQCLQHDRIGVPMEAEMPDEFRFRLSLKQYIMLNMLIALSFVIRPIAFAIGYIQGYIKERFKS